MNRNALKLALVFIGTVLGAGFASGQEFMQFFVVYGKKSIIGVLLSGILLTVCCTKILLWSYENSMDTYGEYLCSLMGKWGRTVEFFSIMFMLCSFCVMAAGAGALFAQKFSWHDFAGTFLLIGMSAVILFFGARGLVLLNAALSPIMIAGIAIIVCYALSASAEAFKAGDIVHNYASSAVLYASYNIFSASAVMVSLKDYVTDRKTAILGGVLGGAALLLVSVIIWRGLFVYGVQVSQLEIPLLYLAGKAGRLAEAFYIVIIFMAVLTTAVANGHAVLERFMQGKINRTKRAAGILLLCLCAVIFSFFKFSSLVSYVYSAFGYLGLVLIAFTLIRR